MSKHEEIAEVLTQDILVGQYRVGERLPSERDLSERFDANRGAVREAMKKLEQLGIADIQPGGARVAPLHEASLDVMGYLLARDDVPNRDLVDQILVVINVLVQTAAIAAAERLSDDELVKLRALIQPICSQDLDEEAREEAHIDMFAGIMAASGNLPVQLIARSLLAQFSPHMEPLHGYYERDPHAIANAAQKIDAAFAVRNIEAIRAGYTELSRYYREQTMRAFDAFEAARQPASMEASAS